ncbi:MAG: hypothetical protein ACRDJC_12765 [Thermomicrobiales bacterium]
MVSRLLLSALIALAMVWMIASPAQGQTDCQTPEPSDRQTFSGDTAIVTEPFTVESGILKATGTHQGDANFIVIVTAEDGTQDFLFNEIGPYSGQASFQVEPGSRLIADIQANGPWELAIEPAF